MNIDQMKYFCEIARCGSILDASRNLHITQPTLSRQLTNMEEELNVQLFQRTKRGMRLTPAGESLFRDWSRILDLYDHSVRNTRTAFEGIVGTLQIGCLDGIKVDYITDFVEYMQHSYPNIRLVLQRLSFRELTDALVHNELDVAFSLDVNFMDQTELFLQNIKPYAPAIAVPKRNPLAKKESLRVSDLKNEPLVIVGKDECEHGVRLIVDICQTYGGFLPDLYYVKSMSNVLLWVEAGMRCAILNMEMNISENSNIRMFPISCSAETNYIQMAYYKKNENFALEFVKKYFSELKDKL